MNRLINYVALSATLIGTAATAVIVQSQMAVSQIPSRAANEFQQKIQQFTVRIDGSGFGSGVIVGKEGNSYIVLTNSHVVAQSGQYKIQTHDGKSYATTNKKKLEGADLAIVYFTSSNEYPIAQIGNSDELAQGQTIYFAGYGIPRPREGERTFLFYQTSLTGRLLTSDIKDGYELTINGDAVPGVSGGPIVDFSGQLMGIYGHLARESDISTTYLYGIPINTAKVLAKLAGISWISPSALSEASRTIDIAYQQDGNYTDVDFKRLILLSAFRESYNQKLVSFDAFFFSLVGDLGTMIDDKKYISITVCDYISRTSWTEYCSTSSAIIAIDKSYFDLISEYKFGDLLRIEGYAQKLTHRYLGEILFIEVHRIQRLP